MKGSLRDQMPGAAALIDELRSLFGREWVDAALREGLRVQQEHARRVREHGQAAADLWLDGHRCSAPALTVSEAGQVVGLLGGRAPRQLQGTKARTGGRACN
jgi:hypothetical protein